MADSIEDKLTRIEESLEILLMSSCIKSNENPKTYSWTKFDEDPKTYVGVVKGDWWLCYAVSNCYCGRCGCKVTEHYSYCPECGGALRQFLVFD